MEIDCYYKLRFAGAKGAGVGGYVRVGDCCEGCN